MTALSNYIRYETRTGQPAMVGDVIVRPISKVLTLTMPYFNLVWNRPVAVVVEQGDSEERLPIVDVVLLTQLLLLALGLATFLLTLVAGRGSKKR